VLIEQQERVMNETAGMWMMAIGLALGVCSWAARDYLEQPVLRRARRMAVWRAGRRAARKVDIP
jgi:hypothetical protein